MKLAVCFFSFLYVLGSSWRLKMSQVQLRVGGKVLIRLVEEMGVGDLYLEKSFSLILAFR